MPEWLSSRVPDGWTAWHLIALSIGMAVGMATVSLFAVGYVLARLPADYFVNPDAQRPIDRHPVLKCFFILIRNAIGYFLIALGVILSLPGVPGQGLLTILMGVMLIDFPGKHRFQKWLVTRRVILGGVNRLRARAGKPSFVLESLDLEGKEQK